MLLRQIPKYLNDSEYKSDMCSMWGFRAETQMVEDRFLVLPASKTSLPLRRDIWKHKRQTEDE